MVLVNKLVEACVKLYKNLGKSGKPNEEEWTVISAIVGVFRNSEIKVLSLGTGSKCIGKSSMSPNGDVLNDSHAEVIARRAFLKYLYLQIIQLNENNHSEIFYRKTADDILVHVKEEVKFYFVTSMVPCGDASIMPMTSKNEKELEMYGECVESDVFKSNVCERKRKHSEETAEVKKAKLDSGENEKISEDIHRTGAKCLADSKIQDPHLPGIFYHNTGAVRTKPGRGDPTLSLSCSDKIARWNALGWQGALLSLLIKTPIFMEGIICGNGTAFSKESFNRAVSERINIHGNVKICQSETCFPNLKDNNKRPNPSSIIWCAVDGTKTEVSINGKKLGVTKKNSNKKIARTSICKKELFLLFEKAVETFENNQKFLDDLIGRESKLLKDFSYLEMKQKAEEYQKRWLEIKKNCFKVWTNKPSHLLSFTLNDEQ